MADFFTQLYLLLKLSKHKIESNNFGQHIEKKTVALALFFTTEFVKEMLNKLKIF